ncbi:hypothetical protein J4421_01905 [Candidatus Woesearchaeota archaeon]|nr:hypothetical protein [Candidatus Woesearchaeota archaeon]
MKKWGYNFLYNLVPLRLLDWFHEKHYHYKTTTKFIQKVDPEFLERISERKALKVYRYALRNIPAYKKFLQEHNIGTISSIKDFNAKLPFLDKDNYVKHYSLLERVEKHHFPKEGMIIESSGSTSKIPTNWFRTLEEEREIAKDVELESHYLFGDTEYIVISCWTLGAWTTSYSFCFYFEPLGLVKNIGPDVEQVVRTIQMMGTKPRYLIGGYPPFIKHLLDTGKLPWKKYKIDLVVGGEGFIPKWREYIKTKLRKGTRIISAYGASDLETGLAVETPLSQEIRNFFVKEEKNVKKILQVEEVPMFFQYNPLRFYINNLPETQEFHATVLTKGHVGVKVKYNIHDLGGKLSYNEMISLMKEKFKGFSRLYETKYKTSSLKLPFLWVGGRSDDVISIDGVNIYPQQIEIALLENKREYRLIQSFQISKIFHHDGDNHFFIRIQLQEGVKPSKKLEKEIKETIKKNLAKVSKAYRLGLHDDHQSFEPHLDLFAYRTGPFNIEKIKNKYIFKKN